MIKLKIHTLGNFGNNSTQTRCTYKRENLNINNNNTTEMDMVSPHNYCNKLLNF